MRREFERENWMNPEMQTTLLNTYPPNLIETILKTLREQLKGVDPLTAGEEIAGPATEFPLGVGQVYKKRGFWVDVNGGNLQENFVLTARREEIECVRSNKVYESVPMQGYNDAGKKLLDLIWVDTDKSVDPAHNKFSIDIVCQGIQTEEAS